MNLKESYRYANCLDRWITQGQYYLATRNFITTTIETHYKSKANSEAKDETITQQKSYNVEFSPTDVVNTLIKLLNERQILADAIAKAKSNTEINIDTAISMNKKKQAFVSILNDMANTKSSESESTAKDYKFDINGEQKPYVYKVNSVTSIDFDRNNVKALAKKLTKETDEISSKLDSIEINTNVEFTPIFDVSDKFEDIVGL